MEASAGPTMSLDIPRIARQSMAIHLYAGDCLFVVGPNGSGKSALIQHLVSSHTRKNIRRISAHRQTSLDSGRLDLTPYRRRRFQEQSTNQEKSHEARWKDHNSREMQTAVLFDLVAKENRRARAITNLVDDQELESAAKMASESKSEFLRLNELLALGTLLISLENSKDEEILAKSRNSGDSYSIAQMSDGERNATMIGAHVLTVEPGTVLLIDEPERHLHRSIIVPFLTALFARREDCTFVISTHELDLPATNELARVLMVRSCEWEGNTAKAWDIDLIEPEAQLPEELRQAILGARRKVLFIEGTGSSLDFPIYNALFPGISVEASGNSIDVIRAVEGMRHSQDFHHVQAYGLIDRDGRCQDDVDSLSLRNVFALDVYSVESLYYCDDSLTAVAQRQAQTLGRDPAEMKETALKFAIEALEEDGIAETMAARRCQHLIRRHVSAQAPHWKTIKEQGRTDFRICVQSSFPDELATFRELVKKGKFDQLVARYPLRHSRVFDAVALALEFSRRELYEQTLIARIQSDTNLRNLLMRRIGHLSLALNGQGKEQEE